MPRENIKKPPLDFSEASPETALVIRSLLPMFTRESDRPERLGTCVLVKIRGHAFAVTAGHVAWDASRDSGRLAFAIGGKLLGLPLRYAFSTREKDPVDLALVPFPAHIEELFRGHGGVFLNEEMIDETENASGLDFLNELANVYLAVGFPGSRSYSRIEHAHKRAHVESYSVRLSLAPTDDYPDGLSRDEHILLDFNKKEILFNGKSINPPQMQGMSGGGVFRFRRNHPESVKLVGILIEQHKDASILVGTRMKAVSSLAAEAIAALPSIWR